MADAEQQRVNAQRAAQRPCTSHSGFGNSIEHCVGGTQPLAASESAAQAVRVLCLVLCSANHRDRCEVVKDTWGRHCDKLVFAADFTDAALGAVDVHPMYEGTKQVTRNKLARGLQHVLADPSLSSFEWFVKADDDSFVIVDNLRRYIAATQLLRRSVEESTPRYLGLRFNQVLN